MIQGVHHHFMLFTDRKSLKTQLKQIVVTAQHVANEELQQRRNQLQKLLENEDQIYEEEFAKKVQSRIGEDIKVRKDTLSKLAAESNETAKKFLESKRVQQYMNSCYQIREELQRKERHVVKECQLEQMLEKERAQARQQKLEKYWVNVQQVNIDREDERQKSENCLKQKMAAQYKHVLDIQMEEIAEKRLLENEEKSKTAKELNELLEQMRLEKFDQLREGFPLKIQKYRQELLDSIKSNREAKQAEALRLADEHRQMMKEIQGIEAEESAAIRAHKIALHKATVDYINYTKRMRQLEEDQQRMRDNRIEELSRVDVCTKKNMKWEAERKARIAEQCYAELRKQVCEEYERRIREEVERRENKMMENRFGREEITREEILAQRRKNREELDKQVLEFKRLRAAEEAKYHMDLGRASNDPFFCAQLAEQYIRDRVDYLEPHANWHPLLCPKKQYIPKPPQAYPDCTDQHSRRVVPITPCGCATRV